MGLNELVNRYREEKEKREAEERRNAVEETIKQFRVQC